MCKFRDDISEYSKGVISGIKGRAQLISKMIDACEELGYDVEKLTDLCIYPQGALATESVDGDGPDDLVKFFMSMNIEVFDKELIKMDPQHSVCRFHYCPLAAAWKEMGLPPERIDYLCNLANKSDFGRASNFAHAQLSFPKRIGAGDDYCEIDVKYVDKK